MSREHLEYVAAFRAASIERSQYHHIVRQNSAKGQHLILCGAGPTLRQHAAEWCPRGDQVWGCNSAVTWLASMGHKVTQAFTVDQTPQQIEEWGSAPDVEYLLATTVHAHMTEFLLGRGRTRIKFFHNFVGIKKAPVSWDGKTIGYEDWLYQLLFPPCVRAGSGLNSVTRAIDVARYMGFARITILGADCAIQTRKALKPGAKMGSPAHARWLRESTVMHADGSNAVRSGATAVTLEAIIDGRKWVTKPDLAISASWLVQMCRRFPEIELVGDTLPNAIYAKPMEFLDQLPHLTDSANNIIRFTDPGDDERAARLNAGILAPSDAVDGPTAFTEGQAKLHLMGR